MCTDNDTFKVWNMTNSTTNLLKMEVEPIGLFTVILTIIKTAWLRSRYREIQICSNVQIVGGLVTLHPYVAAQLLRQPKKLILSGLVYHITIS
ncbi:hypothetical protein L9F63_004607, partial [Diploptera punctata]